MRAYLYCPRPTITSLAQCYRVHAVLPCAADINCLRPRLLNGCLQVGGRPDAARELVGVLQAAPGGGADPAVALLSAAVSLSQGKTVDADRTLEAFCAQCGSGAAGALPASAAVAPTLMRAQVGPLRPFGAPQRPRLSGRAVPENGDLSRHRLLA